MRRERLREGRPHALVRRHLRRAHEEGAGPRLPHRRGAGAPLPPHLRQEPVLQLPAGGADARSTSRACGGSSWCARSTCGHPPPAAPAARDGRERSRARTRLPRLLSRAARSWSRAGSASSAPTSAAPWPTSGRRSWPWTASCPTTAATSSTSPATRTRSASTSPTCAATAWSTWCAGQDVLFNLAGQVSHIDSMIDPFTDLEINCRSQLWILEAVRKSNPGAEDRLRGDAAGLRQAHAPARGRDAPAQPHRRERHQQDLRRVLPPRLPLGVRHPRIVAAPHQHLRPAPAHQAQPPGLHRLVHAPGRCCGEEIQLFGDGQQKRDFDYVDDVVDAFLRAGAMDAADGQVFNLGGEAPVVAARPREAAGRARRRGGSYRLVPFPADRKTIDIGDFYADTTKIRASPGLAADGPAARRARAAPSTYYREHTGALPVSVVPA